MPDGGLIAAPIPTGRLPRARKGSRPWFSPLLRRILLVNLVPLAMLLVALLYLDQYQTGLLQAEVNSLRELARIHAGALGESAARDEDNDTARLLPDQARPLLRRLTDPTPSAQARLYAPDGQLIADSRVREGQGGVIVTEPLPPAVDRGRVLGVVGRVYDNILGWIPHAAQGPVLQSGTGGGPDWQPDVREELRLTGTNAGREMPPYVRRAEDNRLLVTVSEPVTRGRHTVGIILLTREARDVDDSLLQIRLSILSLFTLALALTVLLSFYLARTIARPILLLADAARGMREGSGRSGTVPPSLLAREDEVGTLAATLAESARALWDRMDAIERFAADVAHEIKNPLTSIRSAIETLRRVDDPAQQRRLLAVIGDDVGRLDRLISDISDASRVDAELSRVQTEKVDIRPILTLMAEIAEATRNEGEADILLDVPDGPVIVQGVEDRLVQVLRNLITNAQSFSPPGGRIRLSARDDGGCVEIGVEDDGPGIPDGKLDHVFDRFYSERPKQERFGQHSGLGLSISRQIVEALKGRITAENRRDAAGVTLGARFVVKFPRAG